jgi:tetratricopeptide (TPR) repeat protein
MGSRISLMDAIHDAGASARTRGFAGVGLRCIVRLPVTTLLLGAGLLGCEREAAVPGTQVGASSAGGRPPAESVSSGEVEAQSLIPEGCLADRQTLVDALRARRFAAVAEPLAAIQAKVAEGNCSDRWLGVSFGVFENTEPAIATALDDWIKTEPRSALARAARGKYRFQRAWHNRGTRASRETPPEQFRAMEQLFEDAARDLRDAIDLDSRLTPAYETLIELASASRGPLQEQAIYRRAMEVAPHSYLVRRIVLKCLEPKWGGSLDAIDRYLSDTRRYEGRDPELRLLRSYRFVTEADMLRRAGRLEEALARADAALANGDFVNAHVERAWTLAALGRVDEAAAQWRRVLDHPGAEGYASYQLGRLAQRRRAEAEAITHFGRALEYDGGDPDALRLRARSLWRQGQLDAAIADAAKAADVAPGRADVAGLQAELFYAAKRNDEAVAAATRATSLDPGTAGYWRRLGLARLRLKQATAAIAAFDQAIAREPEDARLYYERAWTFERRLRDPSRALPDYRRAAELRPQTPEYWYSLARAAHAAHDCDVVMAARRFTELCDAGRCARQDPRKLAWARRQATLPANAVRCPAG